MLMSKVAISVKIVPKNPDVDFKKMENKIKEKFETKDAREEPIGFGLKSLRILILKDSEDGGTDDIENYISDLDGVRSVEIESVNKL